VTKIPKNKRSKYGMNETIKPFLKDKTRLPEYFFIAIVVPIFAIANVY